VIEQVPGENWRDLQRRVEAILNECGLKAEAGKTIRTARGNAEIDVYAQDPTTTPVAVYLCECKRWRSRVPQGEVQTFRTVVNDAGAHFGLFISAEGFQAGAFDVVAHTNVHLFNWTGFQTAFVERWCNNHWAPTMRKWLSPLASYAEVPMSDAWNRFDRGDAVNEAEAIGMFAEKLSGYPFFEFMRRPDQPEQTLESAIWARRDMFRRFLPDAAANAETLRDLLDALVRFATDWTRPNALR
jgi:hypothetical protein